ncbi:vitamin B12 ABC transporter substrate-binding protein BtuF [Vibrio sp. HA2012]|uniref:vitamin B12 ABC transporter substrate-binding protein BtuF n=1 Tax=Vibrio sp. HA2012 TaxID=1971595 RepID=UPI000C2B7CE4|nr:vitamin B12 ABC transporter substrate-binding protein BtuF [Vibrio sp. HA2012]PJC86221.1 vitamin B12 ABC transporter substrate-binding protein BtuF [Vibrio sp. HA2012]
MHYPGVLLFCLLSAAVPAAERIISLSPGATELLYAAGLGDKLIAASDYSDYPPEAKALERVSSYSNINIERIIALDPDLLVAWRSGGQGKAIQKLQDLGFHIYYADANTLNDIASRIEDLSRFAANPATGKSNAAAFRQRLAQLQKQYKNNKTISYFYQLGGHPIYTVTEGHWPSEVFSVCGGKNIFPDGIIAYPQVSTEQVIVRQPETIFVSARSDSIDTMWQQWETLLPAVQKGHVKMVNPDWVNRPTPRSLNAVEEICHYFAQLSSDTE